MTNVLDERYDHRRYDVPSPRAPRLQLHVSPPRGEDPDPADARTRREASRSLGLSALLQRRPDLAGVHAPADAADEFLRWSL